jgi:CubicO group peptidase (beta-lactamase class C family)
MPESLNPYLDRAVDRGVPGAAAIVVSADEVIAIGRAGVRRLGRDEPISIEDRFHLGSNTKAFVAVLTLGLIEDGAIGWDTTVAEVLPGDVLDAYRPVATEMLLRHHAGVPPFTDDEADDYRLPEGAASCDLDVGAFARWLVAEYPPILEPGSGFSYSNAGYAVVAAMLETVTGDTWDRLLSGRVLSPLGVTATVGEGWPARTDPAQPWGHLPRRRRKPTPHPPDGDYQLEPFLGPAGDMSMSLPEYGRFLQANLAGLAGSDTAVSAEGMSRIHNQGEEGLGMGWGVTTLKGMEQLGRFSTHAGSAGTFVVGAAVSHDHDRAFAVAINSGDASSMGELLEAIIADQAPA